MCDVNTSPTTSCRLKLTQDFTASLSSVGALLHPWIVHTYTLFGGQPIDFPDMRLVVATSAGFGTGGFAIQIRHALLSSENAVGLGKPGCAGKSGKAGRASS